MKTIEFLYDFGSPYAYLVHKVLPDIAANHGATLVYKPVLLGGIFKATNNQSPAQAFAEVAGKLAYQNHERDRFVARHNIAYQSNPHFPVNTLALMRGATYAQSQPWNPRFIDTMYDAMWRDGEDMGDPDVVRRVLTAAGLPTAEIFAAIQTPAVKTALIDATLQAVQRGAFGTPTMFVGPEMYFGKESLNDLEYDLTRLA